MTNLELYAVLFLLSYLLGMVIYLVGYSIWSDYKMNMEDSAEIRHRILKTNKKLKNEN